MIKQAFKFKHKTVDMHGYDINDLSELFMSYVQSDVDWYIRAESYKRYIGDEDCNLELEYLVFMSTSNISKDIWSAICEKLTLGGFKVDVDEDGFVCMSICLKF